MRTFFVSLAVLGLAACSSQTSTHDTTADTAPPEPVFGAKLAGEYIFATTNPTATPCEVSLVGLGEASPDTTFGFATTEECVAAYPIIDQTVGWHERGETIVLLAQGGTPLIELTRNSEGNFTGAAAGTDYLLTPAEVSANPH